jgi:phosphate-selective porin OprO/OprP
MRSRRSAWPAIVAAGVIAGASIPALSQAGSTEEALRQRVEELEAKLKRLEERLEQRAAAAPAAPAAAAPAAAQPTPGEEALQQQVQDLDQQVRILGRKQELDREAAEAKARETASVFAGKDGFGIKSPDDAFLLRFRAHVQADYRAFIDDTGTDQFLMRRVRPILEGTLYEKFGFRIMPELAGGFQMLDAYVDANLFSYFRIRAGKMKGPVGYERLQSPADLLMMERGFPTQLVPNRDIGIQFSGHLLSNTLTYQAGVFDGTVDGSSTDGDNNNDKDLEARLFATPFRNTGWNALRGLGVGVAYTNGIQSGSATTSNLPRFLTPGQNTFFTYNTGAFANGARYRYVPQLYYSWGPFGLLGEYAISEQKVTRGTNNRTVRNSAWSINPTYLLTGEDATSRGVMPRRPFNIATHDWGAFELAARYGELDVDDDVFAGSAATQLANPSTQASRATEYGIGLNWYLSRSYRVVFNYEYTQFDGGAPDGGDREAEQVFMTRFQLYL